MKQLIKPKSMVSLGRLGIYLITFVVVVSILAALTNFWQSIDYYVYKTFYLNDSEEIKLRSDITLIDLPYHAEGTTTFDRGNYRKRLSDLLDTIGSRYDANERPEAVVLDIFFTNDAQELETLKAAIKRLIDKQIKVYAVYDMRDHDQTFFEKHDAKQAQDLYENYFEGYRLHTMFEEKMGVLSYQSELKFASEHGGYQLIEALASKVARDINMVDAPPSEPRGYILPLGNEQSIVNQTFTFRHTGNETTGGEFSKTLNINDKILVVGSLEEDQLVGIQGGTKTGTHLLTWALFDQLKGNQLAKQPLNNITVNLAMILFFAFFATMIFALLFKYVKSLQTKPMIIAILSFLISAVLLIGVGFAVLAMDKVIPVGLTLLGMLVAVVLAWRFAKKFLVTGIVEGSGDHDVFISYSHGNYKWVKENVYLPLTNYVKPDGKKLKIFFDEKSIGIGEQFTIKYMYGIVDSKIFIPIFNDDYYKKNHCKNEMNLAIKRKVEELIILKPIARKFEYVPDVFTHITLIDASVNENFMELLKNDLTEIFLKDN